MRILRVQKADEQGVYWLLESGGRSSLRSSLAGAASQAEKKVRERDVLLASPRSRSICTPSAPCAVLNGCQAVSTSHADPQTKLKHVRWS